MHFLKQIAFVMIVAILTLQLQACGFHLQGELPLAKPLRRMFLQTPDPYGHLARDLEQYLKMSHVELVSTPEQASTILNILQDYNSQTLLSVSATQQTRQYNLIVTVEFELSDSKGKTILPKETLKESRAITIQSNQVLGGSNEAAIIYQQIRRSLAYAIINRLASKEATEAVTRLSNDSKR